MSHKDYRNTLLDTESYRKSCPVSKMMQAVIFAVSAFFLLVFSMHIFKSTQPSGVFYSLLMLAFQLILILLTQKFGGTKFDCGAIFLIAFLFRFICLLSWPIPPMSDSLYGFEVSTMLDQTPIGKWHEVFKSQDYYYLTWCMHVPYIVYQSLCMKLFGGTLFSIQIVNVLFSALSCVWVTKITMALFKDKKLACLAGILLAFNPTCLLTAAFLVNQHISTCLMLAALYIFIAQPFKKTWVNAIAFGVVLALSHLMRPEMQVVLMAVCCFLIYMVFSAIKNKKAVLKKLALSILVSVVSFFAVVILTDVLFSSIGWIGGSIQSGNLDYKLAVGLNQETNGKFLDADYPLAADREASRALLESRLSNLPRTLMLFAKKWVFQFSSYNYWWLQAEKGGATRQMFISEAFEPLLQSYMMFILFAAFLTAMKHLSKRNYVLTLLYIIFIGYLCAFALIEVQQRYTYMLIPIYTILASVSLQQLPTWIKKRLMGAEPSKGE